MSKYAESDQDDWPVWQANHNNWTKFVSAELDYRAGRAANPVDDIRDKDGLLTGYSLATPGSSSSNLSTVEAFQRGYQGGWAK
jgi:hypothetical protein